MSKRINRKRIVLILLSMVALLASILSNSSLTIIPYVIFITSCLYKRKNYFSPMIFLFLPWSFAISMFYSSMIEYRQKRDDYFPVIYLIVCLLLIWAGYILGERIKIKSSDKKRQLNITSKQNTPSSQNIVKLITIMSVVGIMGSLLGIIDLVYISGIDRSSVILMRESYMTKQSNIVAQVSNVLSWMSLLTVPSFFFLGQRTRKINRVVWALSLGLYVIASMFTAGRQIVFSITIMFIVSYLMRVYIHPLKSFGESKKIRRDTKRYKKIIVIMAVLAAFYMFFIATARTNKSISSTKIGVLKHYFDFTYCEWLDRLVGLLPIGLSDGLIEGLVYFTHQIGEFDVFWYIPPVGPFWGLYSFPFVDRRLSFLHLSYSMEDKLMYVRSYMNSQGIMPVGWKTAISYYILDYGKIGALFFCFALGVIAKKCYIEFITNKTFFGAVRLIMMSVYMFYTIMMPATCETALFFMILFSVVMGIIEKGHESLRFIIQ